MPRYIDADAIHYVEIGKGVEIALASDIDKIPTVSPDEARGVVHCKDCKWCHAGYCEKYDDLIPWGCANKPWEDWFCADGAKMEVSE